MTFKTRRLSDGAPLGKSGMSAAAPAALGAGRILLGWYRRWKERRAEAAGQRTRVRILRRIIIVLLSVLAALLIVAGVVKGLVATKILTLQTFLQATGAELPVDADGYTNFLLLGAGDKGHDGVDLTDTIMIASIDPKKTKSIVLLSIPRDLYVTQTERMGRGRVNSLYRDYKWYLRNNENVPPEEVSKRALRELADEIGRQMQIDLHHVVKVDFIAFVKIVDALGGIDVEVPQDIVDTEYPGPNYSYETFAIKAGPQHLDGETALKYARSRHTTSDFDRSARQQQILKALTEKARTTGLATSTGRLTSLFKILSENVETTMKFPEILGAAKIAQEAERQNIISMNLHTSGGYYGGFLPLAGGFLYDAPRDQFGGAAVLLPTSIPASPVTWKQPRTFLHLLLRSRALYLEPPQIVIVNAGARSGLARQLAAELIRYGFDVADVGNASDDSRAPERNLETSAIVPRMETDAGAASFFSSLLQIPTGTAPPQLAPERLGQVTILLGKDYEYVPMQDLVFPSGEEYPRTNSQSSKNTQLSN